jgi:ATP-dependent exoDNAse (exonuclease V) alpha subunit
MAFKTSKAGSTVPAATPAELAHQHVEEGPLTVTVLADESLPGAFGREMEQQLRRMVADALRNITKSKAYFREDQVIQQVLKMAQRELENRVDVLEDLRFPKVIDAIVQDQHLVVIGTSNYRTTQEMATLERLLIELAGAQTPSHCLPESTVDAAIAACKGISEEQVAAVLAATRTNQRVTVIEGTAGAGKSFTMKAIKDAFTARGYEVMGTALGWNAAKVLESSAGLADCMAIEGFVRKMLEARDKGTDFFRAPTLVIVDEAGMVGARHMKHLLQETARSRFPVKVVLTGDSLQVNPVDAGNSLQAIIAFHGTTRIETIRRQAQESHRVAVKQFSQRQAGKALHTYLHQEAIHWAKDKDSLFNLVVRDFVSYRTANPNKKALILALSNKDVVSLNQRIRKAYKKAGFVDAQEIIALCTDGRESWETGYSVGDEVVLRANSKDLVVYKLRDDATWDGIDKWPIERTGAYNRNSGKIVAIRRSKNPAGSCDIMVDMGGDTPGRVIINTATFKHGEKKGMPMVHNFATTIYASQGQTVDQVYMLDSPMMEFRLAYVGMSRHREGVEVYLDETDLHHRMDNMIGRGGRGVDGNGNQLPTKLGRFRRSEMLQTVSAGWAKQAENLTVTMFERDLRLGKPPEPPIEELAQIQPGIAPEKLLDWTATVQKRTPKVDMERLLALPDPIAEQDLVAPSDVDKVRPLPLSTVWVPPEPGASPIVAAAESLWEAAKRVWKNVPGEGVVEKATHVVTETVQKLTEGPTIPLAPQEPLVGQVLEDGSLSFEGVPGAATIDGSGPSVAFLNRMKGKCWDVGRFLEPRVLALARGQVVARYRLDGTCVVGEGYPPLWVNPQANPDVPVYIVPGAREWLWFLEHQQERHAQDPKKIPHAVWWGKDMDMGILAKPLAERTIKIARSRHDESQIPWALDVQRQLKEKWGINASIIPEIPVPAPAVDKRRPGP